MNTSLEEKIYLKDTGDISNTFFYFTESMIHTEKDGTKWVTPTFDEVKAKEYGKSDVEIRELQERYLVAYCLKK